MKAEHASQLIVRCLTCEWRGSVSCAVCRVSCVVCSLVDRVVHEHVHEHFGHDLCYRVVRPEYHTLQPDAHIAHSDDGETQRRPHRHSNTHAQDMQ